MKVLYMTLIAVLLCSCIKAQTSDRISTAKVKLLPATSELALNNQSTATDPRLLKHPCIMSPNPLPKADPAREEMAKRKPSQAIKELKSN